MNDGLVSGSALTPQRGFARLFNPRGIAVIGASPDTTRIGGQPIPILLESGYAGGIYPVNPKYPQIGDLKCYASIADVPQPCDLALVAVVLLIQQWLRCWVTEIAVTNRRVIYKKGLVRRQTNEMNMDKVESVKINQSILGRMLDYGDLTILGTGEGFETLRTIASPIELRNSITGTTHKA